MKGMLFSIRGVEGASVWVNVEKVVAVVSTADDKPADIVMPDGLYYQVTTTLQETVSALYEAAKSRGAAGVRG